MARKKRKSSYGHGCVYERGPGKWWVKWREDGRVRYSGPYETRVLADQVRAKIIAEVTSGRSGLPAQERAAEPLHKHAHDWLQRRKHTHRAAADDTCRWNKHLKPFFGHLMPKQVDAAAIRRYVEAKLASGLDPATVGHTIRLLSTFFSDLVENGHAGANPVRALPRSTRRLYRPTHDPKATPVLEKLDDVRRVFLALPEPANVAFAIGALAGLRTGEVLGLEWRDIDLTNGRIHVQRQVQEGEVSVLKDDESRVVPILTALSPILKRWRLKTSATGKLFAPKYGRRGGKPGSPPRYMRAETLRRHFALALTACNLPAMRWYDATRHTFASQWVMNDGSIEKLAAILGHSSTQVTERYAHLRTDLFGPAERERLNVSLVREEATVSGTSPPTPEPAAHGA